MIETIRFKLNGRPVRLKVDGEQTLLWVLRTNLGLTGAKYGCGEGLCGALYSAGRRCGRAGLPKSDTGSRRQRDHNH